jgi:uncharacterized membrane protein
MGAGLALVVVGAILAFAVSDHMDNVNLPVVGLILMIAGAAVIANAKRTAVRERTVVERDGDHPGRTHVVEEVVRYNDVDDAHRRDRY